MNTSESRTGLYVPVTTYTTNLGGSDPDSEWTCDSYSDDNYMPNEAFIVDKIVFADIVVGAVVKPGDMVHVLWCEYSTGSSFHHHSGKYSLIAGFIDAERAHKCAQQCREASEWSIDIELDDGTIFQYGIPWMGYFENLLAVHVQSVIVNEKH